MGFVYSLLGGLWVAFVVIMTLGYTVDETKTAPAWVRLFYVFSVLLLLLSCFFQSRELNCRDEWELKNTKRVWVGSEYGWAKVETSTKAEGAE